MILILFKYPENLWSENVKDFGYLATLFFVNLYFAEQNWYSWSVRRNRRCYEILQL